MNQFEAAKTGNLEWFKTQLSAQTLPNLLRTESSSDLTPYELASQNGHLDVLRWLVEESPSISASNLTDTLNCAVHEAAANGHVAIIQYLVNDSDYSVDVTTRSNLAMLRAARAGQFEVVRYLIEDSNQDVDVLANRQSVASWAESNGYQKLATYLTSHMKLANKLGSAKALRLIRSEPECSVAEWLERLTLKSRAAVSR
jgi:ankyrin repeat protein